MIARIIDIVTMFAVLWFLTKEQVGVASLVVSVGMIIEAFDGLGTSEALIQARSVSRLQLDTLFWIITGAAMTVAALTLGAAHWIEKIYGLAGMATYFLAIAIKQPLVGAAVIPLAMMNRGLQYERVAIVTTGSTLAAAVTRLGLAMSGGGAWALVGGYSVSGFYVLIGAFLARPFLPRPRFQLSAVLPLLSFGMRAATSNVLEQIFKNVDYLLVGWFYGAPRLAIYRVAFDVAMEPAIAAGTLVNRTALPVFARVAAVKEHMAETLLWSLRRLVALVAPLMIALMLAAVPLSMLLHDQEGKNYAAAALPMKILAAAALLRVLSQVLFPLLIGLGKPEVAARLSAVLMLSLSTGVLVLGFIFRPQSGIVAVSMLWFCLYPPLLIWTVRYLRRAWKIQPRDLATAFTTPFLAVSAMALCVVTADLTINCDNPEVRLLIVLAALALTYLGLYLFSRRKS